MAAQKDSTDILRLIQLMLDDANYLHWVQQIHHFLQGRHLWGYVSGSIKAPSSTDSTFEEKEADWVAENSKIISWFSNTSLPKINQLFGPFDTAKEDAQTGKNSGRALCLSRVPWRTKHFARPECWSSTLPEQNAKVNQAFCPSRILAEHSARAKCQECREQNQFYSDIVFARAELCLSTLPEQSAKNKIHSARTRHFPEQNSAEQNSSEHSARAECQEQN
ncbi:hypothetical protein RJ639_046797 [Escallonia herrerae]|uniref:Retrotransposon Copia-like N-terminal domain-containing protein n=1 Tax=Escallonia herrerae TaxID=1293975 RepID=A0AA88WHI5_9ASTE|nr:hypothetical protein RJ639_046797 [Escallonia herrerae]